MADYKNVSFRFILLFAAISVIYCLFADKGLVSSAIYILFALFTAQTANIMAAVRADKYINDNYKELYQLYHTDYSIVPDNVVIQILMNIHFRHFDEDACAINEGEQKKLRTDKNFAAIKKDVVSAAVFALFSILYCFLYFAVIIISK